ERVTITKQSQVGPHDWSEELVAHVRETLQQFAGVRAAYLCRLLVKHLPERPCYILGLVPEQRSIDRKSAELRAAVAKHLKIPHELMVFILTLNLEQLEQAMQQVPGAKVK